MAAGIGHIALESLKRIIILIVRKGIFTWAK
jgi:hypothetical protein